MIVTLYVADFQPTPDPCESADAPHASGDNQMASTRCQDNEKIFPKQGLTKAKVKPHVKASRTGCWFTGCAGDPESGPLRQPPAGIETAQEPFRAERARRASLLARLRGWQLQVR